MKKIIYFLAIVLAAITTSCNNDEIVIKKNITFKINPSTVVSDFVEHYAGALTTIGDSYKLRVHLLAYDQDDKLVSEDVQYFSDYTHMMTSSLSLENGQYTIVVITDIRKDDGFEYWTLSNYEKLSTTTLTNNGYIGQYTLLGLTSKQIVIDETVSEQKIDVKPAGAIIYYSINNWNAYSDILTYELRNTKSAVGLTLNENGEPEYSVQSSYDYDWRSIRVEYDSNYSGFHGYYFSIPMKGVKYSFVCGDVNDDWWYMGDDVVIDIKQGCQYEFILDVETNTSTFTGYDVGARSSMPSKAPKADSMDMKFYDNAFDSEKRTINVAKFISGSLKK